MAKDKKLTKLFNRAIEAAPIVCPRCKGTKFSKNGEKCGHCRGKGKIRPGELRK